MANATMVLNPTSKLWLTATVAYATSSSVSLTWSSPNATITSYLTATGPDLVVAAGSMTPGGTYAFTVAATAYSLKSTVSKLAGWHVGLLTVPAAGRLGS